MRISAKNGLAMQVSSSLWREDAEERDNEVDAEEGLEVAVRLDAAGRANRARRHRRGGSNGREQLRVAEGRLSDKTLCRAADVGKVRGRQVGMAVGRDL